MKKTLKLLSIFTLLTATLASCNEPGTSQEQKGSESAKTESSIAESSKTESSSQIASSGETSTQTENSSVAESSPEQSSSVEEAFSVKFIETLPVVVPYQDFDVNTVINKVEGATYTFEGMYLDGRLNEKTISFTDGVMNIPQDNTAAEITVTGTLGDVVSTKELTLSVYGTPDVIDYGVYDLWAEDMIGKGLNYNPKYIKDGASSVKVTFNGYYNSIGTQFACSTGRFSNNDDIGIYDTEYLSLYKKYRTEQEIKTAFEDAVICFWVYNDMKDQTSTGYDDSLYFCVRIAECSYSPGEGQAKVDTDWGNVPIIEAKRGEWTLVYWYLKDAGKDTPIYKDMTKFYDPTIDIASYRDCYDAFNYKVLGKNVEQSEPGTYNPNKKYSYTFYVDGYDIMTRADFLETYAEYFEAHKTPEE